MIVLFCVQRIAFQDLNWHLVLGCMSARAYIEVSLQTGIAFSHSQGPAL